MQRWNVGLEAKIHKPKMMNHMIIRQELERDMDRSHEKLIVFHATMGFGKTVFVNSYGSRCGRSQSWYHISSLDNDMVTFVEYLSASVAQVWPEFTFDESHGEWEDLPRMHQRLGEEFISCLRSVQELSNERQLDMVLDDFQEIHDEETLRFVDRLVQYLPDGIRMLITTKSSVPSFTTRYLLSGDARVFEAQDLAFSREEVGALMDVISDGAKDQKSLDAVYSYSEGWPAGVMFLCLFLKQKQMVIGLDGMDGVMRESRMHDFIMYELFRKLPFEIQRFLVRTAPLDYLSTDICLAVSGVKDAAGILEYLIQEGLFIQKVDGRIRVYRYHSLFRDFLLSQLTREELQEVQEQAAVYLLNTDQKEQAAAYAMECGSREVVVKAMESVGLGLLEDGRSAILGAWIQFTEDREDMYSPRAAAASGFYHILLGETKKGLMLLMDGMAKAMDVKDEKTYLICGERAVGYLWKNRCFRAAGSLVEKMKRDYAVHFPGRSFPRRELWIWSELFQGREQHLAEICENPETAGAELQALCRILKTSEKGGPGALEALERELQTDPEVSDRARAFCGYKMLARNRSLPMSGADEDRLSLLEREWAGTPWVGYGNLAAALRLFKNGERKRASRLVRRGMDLLGEMSADGLSLRPEELNLCKYIRIIGEDSIEDGGCHLVAFDFGDFKVHVAETGEELRWRTRKAQECVAWFLHNRGRKVSREELLAALWDVDDIPANEVAALHNILSSIRKTLKPCGMENLIQYQDKLYFLQEGHIYDERPLVDQLCSLIDGGDVSKLKGQGQWLLALTYAPYMNNMEGSWCQESRYAYENTFLKGLALTADYCAQNGVFHDAVRYYQRAFEMNPYEDRLLICAMECTAAVREPRDVRRLYNEAVKRMKREIGREPGPELKNALDRCVRQSGRR